MWKPTDAINFTSSTEMSTTTLDFNLRYIKRITIFTTCNSLLKWIKRPERVMNLGHSFRAVAQLRVLPSDWRMSEPPRTELSSGRVADATRVQNELAMQNDWMPLRPPPTNPAHTDKNNPFHSLIRHYYTSALIEKQSNEYLLNNQ